MNCDGYGASTNGGDGMTQLATSLAIFNLPGNGNMARHEPARGAAAAEACDAALAALQPQHWLRKTSLLRARAVHRLEANDLAAANVDIDQAEALLRSHKDALADGSMGVGLTAVQAFASRASGDRAQARTLAFSAVAARPMSRTTPYLALMAIGPAGDAKDIEDLLKEGARFNPAMLNTLFERYLRQGRYAEAVELYPQLTVRKEFHQFEALSTMRQRERSQQEIFAAAKGLETAYALAALGKGAEARALVAEINQRLAAAIKDPPELTGEPDSKKAAERALIMNTNLQIASRTKPFIDAIGPLVDLRLMILDGHAQEAADKMRTMRTARSWMSIDLIEAVGAALPAQQASAKAAAQAEREKLLAETDDFPKDTLDEILKNLPPTEIDKSFSTYKLAGILGWLNPDPEVAKEFNAQNEGYRSLPADKAGNVLVRYRSHRSPTSMVEDMALLRAAELAHEAGKSGFVIVNRRDVPFTMSMTQYGRVLRTDPDGSETELEVAFIDAAPGPDLKLAADWRVLKTDEVLQRLKPVYEH